MSSIANKQPTRSGQSPKYFVEDQVLLIFSSADGKPVFPDNGGKAPLETAALEALLAGVKAKFSDAPERQYVVVLSASRRAASALAQLELLEGTVEGCVTALSKRLSGQNGKPIEITNYGRTLWLTHVAPNWLSGGAPQVIGTGGPGMPPRRVAGTPGPTAFTIPGLDKCASKRPPKSQDVHVFILDTLPGPRPSAGSGRVSLPAQIRRGLQSHPLGLAWLKRVESDDDSSGRRDEVTVCDTDLTREWADPRALAALAAADYRIEGHTYDMSDHGLFIAGVVKQIAPEANIHIVEVLNEFGVGSASMIAAGIDYVRRFKAACPKAICIVNCSFTLAVPVLTRQTSPRWKRAASPHPTRGLPRAILRLLGNTMWTESFLEKIIRLPTAGSRIVAAAGNESNEAPTIIRAARYPARLPTVLGVGALDPGGDRAWYSNYPDAPIAQGLMTLGSVRSLFTGRFPIDPAVPTYAPGRGNGYAVWSGTSFAAPIISGALAKLVSEHGHSLRAAENCLRGAETTMGDETLGEVVTARQDA